MRTKSVTLRRRFYLLLFVWMHLCCAMLPTRSDDTPSLLIGRAPFRDSATRQEGCLFPRHFHSPIPILPASLRTAPTHDRRHGLQYSNGRSFCTERPKQQCRQTRCNETRGRRRSSLAFNFAFRLLTKQLTSPINRVCCGAETQQYDMSRWNLTCCFTRVNLAMAIHINRGLVTRKKRQHASRRWHRI